MKRTIGYRSLVSLDSALPIVLLSAPASAQQPAPHPPSFAPVPYKATQPVPYAQPQPAATPPTAASAPSAPAGPGGDTIYLKSGGFLRGTLIDAIPNAQ